MEALSSCASRTRTSPAASAAAHFGDPQTVPKHRAAIAGRLAIVTTATISSRAGPLSYGPSKQWERRVRAAVIPKRIRKRRALRQSRVLHLFPGARTTPARDSELPIPTSGGQAAGERCGRGPGRGPSRPVPDRRTDPNPHVDDEARNSAHAQHVTESIQPVLKWRRALTRPTSAAVGGKPGAIGGVGHLLQKAGRT